MTVIGATSNVYNGDGTLVSQVAGGITTRYTQDLAAPLTQLLQIKIGTNPSTDYLYGLNRLASLSGSTRTWYIHDALGSVRRTVADAGTPLDIIQYDPWGTVESGNVPTFGFTGEMQQGSNVYLRARWYNAGRGTFPSHRWRTDESNDQIPYSHHPYAYAWGNPISLTDPTGKNPFPDPIGRVSFLEGVYIGAVIAMAFIAGNPSARHMEYPVPGASTGRGSGRLSVNGFADLVDFTAGEVYEIKSQRAYLRDRAGTLDQLYGYVDGLNLAATQPPSSRTYRPPPTTGTWSAGSTFLAGGVQSFGLWPYGIDPSYNPAVDGYYEIKATLSNDKGVIIYWGQKITAQRARVLVPQYAPGDVVDFVDEHYQDWRKPNWGRGYRRPQLYPGMSLTNPGYWCSVIGDIAQYYYEEVGRFGNQLDPNSGMTPGIPGSGSIPVLP